MHTVMRARSGPGGGWIVEGLAEFYSLELLVRSGTISRHRYEKTLSKLERRGRGVKKLEDEFSAGAVTARAVAVLRELDQHTRKQTSGKASLDDVLRAMKAAPEVWISARFQKICERVAGTSLEALFKRWIPEVGGSNSHFGFEKLE
jgi:predicted metalloprotease with PDZ domain